MRKRAWVPILATLLIATIAVPAPQNDTTPAPPLPWAYGFQPDGSAPIQGPPCLSPKDDGTLRHVPGSALAFTLTQVSDCFNPADWFPQDHPPMPDIVAHGRKPDVNACAVCHYSNGQGRPENAGVAGLPIAYFLQQMSDFKSGARKSAEARKRGTTRMIAFAKAMTDDEMKASADYFGSLKWTPWIKVVETADVPKTRIAGNAFIPLAGNETEPLGQRIIEVPVNVEDTEALHDPRSPFIAYAPFGSLKKGEDLATTGNSGRTIACAVCHGSDLRGLGPVPPIAGRSPTYAARQLYDFQHGARNGPSAHLMQQVVEKLTSEDILYLSAYLASRAP